MGDKTEKKVEHVLMLKMRDMPPAAAARMLRRIADEMEDTRSSGGEVVEDGVELAAWLWDHDVWEEVEPRCPSAPEGP